MTAQGPSGAPLLIVDDDPDDVFALNAVLTRLGRPLLCAESGEQALRLLLAQDVGLIIMDLMMPRLNGFETAALIRQRERSKTVPIVFLTGFDTQEVRFIPGFRPDFTEFARKPVDPDDFVSKLRSMLDGDRPTKVI